MKVGDLVKLSQKKTLRGMPYENRVGLIVDFHIIKDTNVAIATVNFSGELYELAVKDLRVISHQ